MEILNRLSAGMPIVYGGDKVVHVSAELADAFLSGDRLIVLQDTGDLLRIPQADWDTAAAAVGASFEAFRCMGSVTDDQISAFFLGFADRLADDTEFEPIGAANKADVAMAHEAGRSTTRLLLTDSMRSGMVDGLRMWATAPRTRGSVVETIAHRGWKVELVTAGLGVVGFVFEGRPNVFADATGVLRAGNTVVFRIGSAALGTARAIVGSALRPALADSGLPENAVTLVDAPSRAAGWAMFADPRLSLAVARGSGAAVGQLGGVARQFGTPVSLHGSGGAWIVAADHTDPDAFAAAVFESLDRKVCNTLNTCCIVESKADQLIPVFLDSLDRAGDRRGAVSKLHVAEGDDGRIPAQWFDDVDISRAEGLVREPRTEIISGDRLGAEWEWENSPEVTLRIVSDLDAAVELFNEQSPRFVVSLISSDEAEHRRFWEKIDSPFVGNGFTRWVDGQFALDRPELGLSNWQHGRLFGRGGVLSGDSVYTIRTRAVQDDPALGR
jgi:glutamate-5-semialdehyde dehydrogenase